MASFNKVILLGNLTRDVELRTTPKGATVGSFALAMNRHFTVDGQEREEVNFVEIVAFGKQAETLSKFVSKGSPLHVEGRLKFDQWDDKTTKQKRNKLSVVLESFQFVGAPKAKADAAARSTAPAGQGNIDEDIPF